MNGFDPFEVGAAVDAGRRDQQLFDPPLSQRGVGLKEQRRRAALMATIDALSGGRLIAGVGIGWNRVEFENLGVGERFSHRGAYLEETVALWRHLWSGAEGPWQGRFHGYEDGFFVGGCLFDHATRDMDIYKTEIFGPVLSVVRAKDYEEALALPMKHEYGNGVAIYTRDGDTARDFQSRINIGMVGVNVPIPVPLAYHTFGGWKKSVFGDLNQHGPDAFKFYTRTKTVTSRWPSGIKQGGEFSIPVMQ